MNKQVLQIEDLAVGYSANKALHTNLNAQLNEGEFIALLGPNGAGKSTLIKTIAGFLPSIKGDIRFNNKSITEYTNAEMAKIVSVVLTDRVMVSNLTVRKLVEMGRMPYTGYFGKLTARCTALVEEAIHSVGIEAYADRYINSLSDGERQKVMIAKALVQESPFIILDEPTAFLDFPAKIEIMQLLSNLSRKHKRGILLCTHDLEMALQITDKIWLIAKDKQMVKGAPEDLVLNDHINNFFHRNNIVFDKSLGAFTFSKSQLVNINIVGDGLERHWLEKGLNRVGYIASDDSSTLQAEVIGDRYVLRNNKSNMSINFNSIEEVVEALKGDLITSE